MEKDSSSQSAEVGVRVLGREEEQEESLSLPLSEAADTEEKNFYMG